MISRLGFSIGFIENVSEFICYFMKDEEASTAIFYFQTFGSAYENLNKLSTVLESHQKNYCSNFFYTIVNSK